MTDFRYIVQKGQFTEHSQRFKDSSLKEMIEVLQDKLERLGEESSGRIESFDGSNVILQYQIDYKRKLSN